MKTVLARHGAIVGMLLFVLAAGWLFVQPEPKLNNKLDLSVIPEDSGQYQGEEVDISSIPIEEQLAPQAFLMRDYYRGVDQPVNLCLVYNYARRSRSFHDPWICFPAQGFNLTDMGSRQLNVAGEDVTAYILEAEKYGIDSIVVYWYLSGDKPVEGKGGRVGHLKEAIQARLSRSLGVSSMVRVSSPVQGDHEQTIKRLQQFLDEFYPRILSVKADIAQDPMPAAKLWRGGVGGQLAVAALLLVPFAVAAVGLGASRTSSNV